MFLHHVQEKANLVLGHKFSGVFFFIFIYAQYVGCKACIFLLFPYILQNDLFFWKDRKYCRKKTDQMMAGFCLWPDKSLYICSAVLQNTYETSLDSSALLTCYWSLTVCLIPVGQSTALFSCVVRMLQYVISQTKAEIERKD